MIPGYVMDKYKLLKIVQALKSFENKSALIVGIFCILRNPLVPEKSTSSSKLHVYEKL